MQRYIALHAVGPNSEVSSTSADAAARAGQRPSRRQQPDPDRPVGRGAGPGAEIPCCARARRPRSRDPVAGPGGAQADPHLDVVEPVVLQAMHEVVAHRGHRRAAGVRRRDRDHDLAVTFLDRRAARRGPPGSASASPGRSRRQRLARRSTCRRRPSRSSTVTTAPSGARARPTASRRAVAERLGVPAVAARAAGDRADLLRVRTLHAADREHLLEHHGDLVGHRRRVDPDPLRGDRLLDGVAAEQLVVDRPDHRERGLQPARATPRCPAPA